MISIRDQEKLCFMRAFNTYIVPFMEVSKERKVIIRKEISHTAIFEFAEENDVITVRHFPDDLIFAYPIAVEAIYETTRPGNKNKKNNQSVFNIVEYDNYAVVTLK